MALSSAGLNAAAAGVTAVAGFASLHTANPGGSGTSEVTGGSPAYARKAITWGSPSAGVVTLTGAATFDVPATTVAFVGLWSASSGGTFYGSAAVTSEVYAGQGTYVLAASTSLTVT